MQQVYETFAASCKNIIAEQSQADDERVRLAGLAERLRFDDIHRLTLLRI